MKKYLKTALILAITIIIILIFFLFSMQLTGKAIENLNHYSYTKAICNKTNYCQDYEIICNGQNLKTLRPITGSAVQNPENWQDPRNKKAIEKLC